MSKPLRILLIAFVLSFSVFGLTSCQSSPAPASVDSLESGAPRIDRLAPDFRLMSLEGQPVSLKDFRGKPVLLNFWASWCGPCREEMPFFQQIFEDEKLKNKGLVILAVNIGENQATVKDFMASNRLFFPVLLDTTKYVALEYNVRSIPATYFIDADGVIRDVKIGSFASKDEIERKLASSILK